MENNKETEKKILDLLKAYHHYLYMTSGLFGWMFKGYYQGMNIIGFMEWLQSRNDINK